MMRVLFDTNVVLDFLLDRAPFAEAAAVLWQANEDGRIEAYVSAVTPVNVFYIARKLKDIAAARTIVAGLLAACRACPLDHDTLQTALTLPMCDFEDAVQYACAVAADLDAIVTRDGHDYGGATLPVLTPAELLQRLAMTL